MTTKSHPPGSGWLVETIAYFDNDNIEQNNDLGKAERDRPLSFHWTVEADVIRSLGVTWSRNRDANDARNSILTEAMLAHETGQWVSYSRHRPFYTGLRRYHGTAYTYATVLAAVAEGVRLGLLEEKRARSGDHLRTGRQSRFRATPVLVEQWHAGQAFYQLQGLIRLKNADGDLIDFRQTDATIRLSREVAAINEFLAAIRLDINAPDAEVTANHVKLDRAYYPRAPLAKPEIYRVFNQGVFTKGGRGYGPWQSFKKQRRQAFLLDGEPVAEPDFRSLHPTMLYAERGITPPDDVYEVDGFTREEGKLALNISINVGGGKAGTVAALLNKRKDLDRVTGQPKWGRDPDKTAALVQAIWNKNSPISDALGARVGPRLMNRDSRIMLDTVKGCMKAGIAVLPVHDSFIVPARHESRTAEVMEEAFAKSHNGAKACRVRVTRELIPHMPSPSSVPPAGVPALAQVVVAGGLAGSALGVGLLPVDAEVQLWVRPVQLDFLTDLDETGADQVAFDAAVSFQGGSVRKPILRIIRDGRRRLCMRQEDLARTIGISRPQLSHWEHGRLSLDREPAARLRKWVTEEARAA